MPAVLKSSFSKCGIGTLSLVHPFQAAKGGPDPGYVSSALRSRRKGQRYVFQPGGIWTEDQRTQKDRRPDTGSAVGRIEYQYRPAEKNRVRFKRPVSGSLDRSCSFFDVSTDYLLMGRDYVNLHSRKRLEGVLQELSGIIADLREA